MTDIERLRNHVSNMEELVEKLHGILDDIEEAKERDRETIERLEEEVADLTSDLEDARRGDHT